MIQRTGRSGNELITDTRIFDNYIITAVIKGRALPEKNFPQEETLPIQPLNSTILNIYYFMNYLRLSVG